MLPLLVHLHGGGSSSASTAVTKQRLTGVTNTKARKNSKSNVDNANESSQSNAEGHSTDRSNRLKDSTSSVVEMAGNSVTPPVLQLIVDELLAYVSFYRINSKR